MNFVTNHNAIRSRGNKSAHGFTNGDILDAIETMAFSTERAKLDELYRFLHSNPNLHGCCYDIQDGLILDGSWIAGF